jgi:integrase
MDVSEDDLEFLRAPIEVSLGTGVRKRTELLQLRIENINFSGFPIFRRANGRDVEVRPNWFLLTDTKGKKPRHRLIPMNAPVKAALLRVIQNRTTGLVFDLDHTGVTEHVLRTAFERACERAKIPFGLAAEGGLIWHDLRRTFATELRARQVHEYDIADLLDPQTFKPCGHLRSQHSRGFGRSREQTRRAERQCDRFQKEGELRGSPSWPHLACLG